MALTKGTDFGATTEQVALVFGREWIVLVEKIIGKQSKWL